MELATDVTGVACRFALKAKGIDPAASQLALAALASLPVDVDGAHALLERIDARHGLGLRSVRQRWI